ncbi:type II toxin-antitoxin system prevent-host-death family antitoxin [Levilactobacillus zymae]|uniref:type II toxin-antitoxin system Phd/YefM family antitoxin n=1 Tax=Levilactobacillus zymae TaxID=267363 RepID=UPI0028B7DCA2|nr:type II toxin-antitoxin system prevent-host-death family antitoxin [Levilactobacillus zymae]MDT6980203.1 type II toxin-antitoxin system prevent-host-death family antitoxin [Levilactobacillus zymae]
MEYITDTELQRKVCHYLNGVTDRRKPVTVTAKNGDEVVIISEADYRNLRANQLVLCDPAHQAWIQESMRQVRQLDAQQTSLPRALDEAK